MYVLYLWKVWRHAGKRVIACLGFMSSIHMQHCSTSPVPFPVCVGSIDISPALRPFGRPQVPPPPASSEANVELFHGRREEFDVFFHEPCVFVRFLRVLVLTLLVRIAHGVIDTPVRFRCGLFIFSSVVCWYFHVVRCYFEQTTAAK